MWVRKCDLDAEAEAPSPIPTRVVSNEEFIPPPQTPEQCEFEARLTDLSERTAREQGLVTPGLPAHRAVAWRRRCSR